jgi:hypothetical protein
MKTAAAAARLGVQPSTLRYWRMIHYGPAYAQLSTRTFVYDEDILIKWSQIGRSCLPCGLLSIDESLAARLDSAEYGLRAALAVRAAHGPR